MGFPGSSAGTESACNEGDPGSILGWEDPIGRDKLPTPVFLGFSGGSDGEESACNVGDLGSIPEWADVLEKGTGNPPQYSCLENPHGQRSLVGYSPWGNKKSQTRLSG